MIELRWYPSHPSDPFAVQVGELGLHCVLQYRESAVAYDEEGRADYAMGWSDWQDVKIEGDLEE